MSEQLTQELDNLRMQFESGFEKIRSKYFLDKTGIDVIKSRVDNHLITFSVDIDLIKEPNKLKDEPKIKPIQNENKVEEATEITISECKNDSFYVTLEWNYNGKRIGYWVPITQLFKLWLGKHSVKSFMSSYNYVPTVK